MPVGCLSSRHVESTLYLSTSSSSSSSNPAQENNHSQENGNSVSSQVETIALMQQTLLIQIFRREQGELGGRLLQGEGECPTCHAFSTQCCQEVEGLQVFQEVQESNSIHFWNLPFLKAVLGLKYQGYVCPGILVTLTDSSGVKILQEAWASHSLSTPPGYTIYRLGLSGGCSVTPFLQAPSPGLPETLCLILHKLKQAECVADMNTILSRLSRDFPALSTNNLPATVHAALGSLIKKRKVYYTGKGYFLVSPDPSTLPKLKPKTKKPVRRVTRENACQTELQTNGYSLTTPPSNGWSATPSWPTSPLHSSQPATHRQNLNLNNISPMGLIHQRHSPRSPLELSPRHSPLQNPGDMSPNIPPLGRISLSSSSPSSSNHSSAHSSTDSSLQESPQTQATLERSQSLRISKKSLKQMSKGGSLRLSKKDALAIMNEVDENTKNQEEEEEERTSPSPKKMERKNSFLGRIFGRKKSNGSPKKEILTFSAQFPPPELEMPRSLTLDLNSVETQTPPHVRRKPTRPNLPSPSVSTAQVKNGPNGNFVVYERDYGTRNPASRPLPQSPPIYSPGTETYDGNNSSHIYSQPSLYSATKPQPPAYSSAPPYRPMSPPTQGRVSVLTTNSSPAPQRPSLVNSSNKPTPQKQVHFAATPRSNDKDSPRRESPNQVKSPQIKRNATSRSSNSESSNSGSGHSSLSGPSSLDSVLYDDTLIVIEKSNQELELRLKSNDKNSNNRTQLSKNRVDTIHNNRHLDQEVIYEDSLSDLSRSSSQSTLKPDSVPDHPSLSDLGSIADLSSKFQSLTARKLMAGLSISSIDTLLEVNAAADKLDESTETIDFGVI